ncbi:hypothetical protein [Photobacterium damselae]|uniref:hypothetical protein n=1 Tax=Photobacterium damselae TaxID=38293 RepID=UPI001F2DD299|nr:hypothetical protein [Photobacterium damselae]UKA04945.1 hypothetical protein IHC89_22125 [Photobacterium damselae subsp. damselae]
MTTVDFTSNKSVVNFKKKLTLFTAVALMRLFAIVVRLGVVSALVVVTLASTSGIEKLAIVPLIGVMLFSQGFMLKQWRLVRVTRTPKMKRFVIVLITLLVGAAGLFIDFIGCATKGVIFIEMQILVTLVVDIFALSRMERMTIEMIKVCLRDRDVFNSLILFALSKNADHKRVNIKAWVVALGFTEITEDDEIISMMFSIFYLFSLSDGNSNLHYFDYFLLYDSYVTFVSNKQSDFEMVSFNESIVMVNKIVKDCAVERVGRDAFENRVRSVYEIGEQFLKVS